MHTNTIQPLPGNRRFDVGDVRFRPGNVLASGRSLGFIFMIDKESGDIVWRYRGQWKGGGWPAFTAHQRQPETNFTLSASSAQIKLHARFLKDSAAAGEANVVR